MKIDNTSISTWGSVLVEYSVEETENEYKSEWTPKSLTPLVEVERPRYKTLKITLLLQGSTRDQVEQNKSTIQSKLKQCQVTFTGSSLIYDGVLDGIKFDKIANLAYYVDITFRCLTYSNQITINLDKTYTQNVNIIGNTYVGAIYEVTTDTTIPTLTINNVTVNNVTAGKKLIIDGVNGIVTLDGANKFKDCVFTEFPTLKPGNQIITINVLTANIVLKYSPRWS